MAGSPFQRALSGDVSGLSERQLKSALGEATSELARRDKKIQRGEAEKKGLAERGRATGTMLLHTGEMLGTTFTASMASGVLGDRMKLGPVDLRLLSGLPLDVLGLWRCLNGKGGAHAMAFGNGLLMSYIGEVGQETGKVLVDAWKQRREPAAVQTADPVGQLTRESDGLTLQMTPTAEGVREVLLTPKVESTEGRRPPRRRRPHHRRD